MKRTIMILSLIWMFPWLLLGASIELAVLGYYAGKRRASTYIESN